MNYRHQFHAGNFADIFKHTLLVILLDGLSRKDTPWCYFDSHAGAGLYNLQSDEARRGDEAAGGIYRLWPMRAAAPAPVAALCAAVAAVARAGDRLVLAELQPEEAQLLRTHLRRDARAAVHLRDGYEMLKALTPPAERRGLVLIDPPFELPTEFAQILQALRVLHGRWQEGMYAVWYPLKDPPAAQRFERELLRLKLRRVLLAEFRVTPPEVPGFRACGMALINPPWQCEHAIETTLGFLRDTLAPQAGSHRLRWLAPPKLEK